jgi:IclR family pca regulon transcriptional regulator
VSTESTALEKGAASGFARFQTSWGREFAAFEGNPDFVLSLARGLSVIESFEGHSEGLSIAEISRQTGLSRAATRRLLITLELLGYVETAGRVYRLRHRVLRLGLSYLSSNSLSAVAQPAVQRITDELDESSAVCVFDGEEALCVAGAVRKRLMSPGVSMGSRLPAYCTALGRVLLAGLPENRLTAYLDHTELKPLTRKTTVSRPTFLEELRRIRGEGYAVVDQELECGLRAIAVPILSSQGHVAAALGVGAPTYRVSTREMQSRFLPLLQEHARVIGQFAC